MAFEDAVKSGEKTFAEHMANGKIVLTDVQECWTRGVSCPELKELPPDILEKWGIVELVEGTATRPPRSGPPQCPSTVGGGAPPGSGSGTSPPLQVGDWTFVETLPTGGTNNGTCTVAVQGNDVRVVSVISSQMVLPTDGRLHHVHGVCTYTGRIRGQTLSATCSEATTTVDGVGVPTPGLPFSFTGQISPDGRKVSGTLSGSLGTSSTVVMQAR